MTKYVLLHKHANYYLKIKEGTSKTALQKYGRTHLDGHRIVAKSRLQFGYKAKGQPMLYKVKSRKTSRGRGLFGGLW